MSFGNFCRFSWRSKVLGAVAGSKLLLCKVTPGSHRESRNTHCFQEPGFKDERGVPELLSFASLRVASVFISETNSPMEELREEDVVFVGSAFAFNRQSLATCAHLFQGPPRRLVVRFGDGRWANAELRGASTATDVAVLKLDVQASPLTFSQSLPKQGERVVVCGMTQHGQEVVGLSGLVSQPRQRFRGLPEEPTMHFVQLALPTLPGMSGSPVLNSEGKVCAMVAKKFEEHGLALPVERVLPVAECLEAGYPWRLPLLGMEVKAGGSLLNPSVLVKAFASASAAAKSGVEVGDEILEINGTKVATLLEMREALLAMGDGRVSSCRVKLRLRRQSRTVDVAFDAPRAPSGPQDVSMIELEE